MPLSIKFCCTYFRFEDTALLNLTHLVFWKLI